MEGAPRFIGVGIFTHHTLKNPPSRQVGTPPFKKEGNTDKILRCKLLRMTHKTLITLKKLCLKFQIDSIG